jgi:hypothetical protein
VCVHDRHRKGGGGRDAATLGVWLSESPLVLGPMGCAEAPAASRDGAWPKIATEEPHAVTRNDWRAAATLETSQFLVALAPYTGVAPYAGEAP